MTGHLPVFGPTGQPFGHEDGDHDVIMRVAYMLSRAQLIAAFRVSFAQLGGERAAADLSVDEIRTEVEEFFAAAGILDVDHAQQRHELAGLGNDELAEAVDRAYAPPKPEPSLPGPRYFDGQVMVSTVDHGAVVLAEPSWCIGHSWQQNPYRDDITHNSTRTKVDVQTEQERRTNVLSAYISWAPFTELVPVVSIALDTDSVEGDYQAEEIGPLTEGLQTAIERLQRLAADAIALRGTL